MVGDVASPQTHRRPCGRGCLSRPFCLGREVSWTEQNRTAHPPSVKTPHVTVLWDCPHARPRLVAPCLAAPLPVKRELWGDTGRPSPDPAGWRRRQTERWAPEQGQHVGGSNSSPEKQHLDPVSETSDGQRGAHQLAATLANEVSLSSMQTRPADLCALPPMTPPGPRVEGAVALQPPPRETRLCVDRSGAKREVGWLTVDVRPWLGDSWPGASPLCSARA